MCHTAGGILDLHAGVEDPNGEHCGDCHEGVSAESHSWTELKNIFEWGDPILSQPTARARISSGPSRAVVDQDECGDPVGGIRIGG